MSSTTTPMSLSSMTMSVLASNSSTTTLSVLAVALNQVDDFFRFAMAALIFFALFGFGLYEVGISSNAAANQQALLKALLVSVASMISFWLFGYALAFGGTNVFGGGQVYWAWSNMNVTNYAHFWLQFSYAALSTVIALGALGERCKMATYIVFPFFWCGFAYPIVAHWVWHQNGWLNIGIPAYNAAVGNFIPSVSFADAAGSGVVLLTGGVAALFGAILIRPRPGRFGERGAVVTYIPHSNTLLSLGAAIIMLGLTVFNGTGVESLNYLQNFVALPNGGNMAVPQNYAAIGQVAIAMTNTVIAAAVGAFTVYFLQLAAKLPASTIQILNGGLSAMASISCAAIALQPWAATIYGFFAGLTYLFWSFILQKLRVDDVIDSYAVYAGGAMWGLIATAFLLNGSGIVWVGNVTSGYFLAWQIVGICAIFAWAGGCSVIIFGFLRLFKALQVYDKKHPMLEGTIATTPSLPTMVSIPAATPVLEPKMQLQPEPYSLQISPSGPSSLFGGETGGAGGTLLLPRIPQ